MATAQGTPGSAPPPHPRAWRIIERKPLTAGRAAQIIALATVAVAVGGGVLMHFADRQNFSTIGRGLWWSIQTITTVGYGDLVPTNAMGQFIAAVVMVTGIGFLTVITATITSSFVEQARQRLEGDQVDAVTARLDQINERLDMLTALVSGAGPQGRAND